MALMDKRVIGRRFCRAAQSYQQEAHIQHRIANHLFAELTRLSPKQTGSIIEIGCGTGNLSSLIASHFSFDTLILNDLSNGMMEVTRERVQGGNIQYTVCDGEDPSLLEGRDIIVSGSTIQWFSSPIRFLKNCNHFANNRALVAISTFGQDNFCEIREICGQGLDYISLDKYIEAACEDFNILYSYQEHHTLLFDNPMEVLRHLKKTGVTGNNSRSWSRGELEQFCDKYNKQFKSDAGVTLTYNPIYLILQKR